MEKIDLITLMKHEGATPSCRAAIQLLWEDVAYMVQCRKRYLDAQAKHRDVHRAQMELKLALDALTDSIAGARAFYLMEQRESGNGDDGKGNSAEGSDRGFSALAEALSLELPSS